jgi:hypothetical protein
MTDLAEVKTFSPLPFPDMAIRYDHLFAPALRNVVVLPSPWGLISVGTPTNSSIVLTNTCMFRLIIVPDTKYANRCDRALIFYERLID